MPWRLPQESILIDLFFPLSAYLFLIAWIHDRTKALESRNARSPTIPLYLPFDSKHSNTHETQAPGTSFLTLL